MLSKPLSRSWLGKFLRGVLRGSEPNLTHLKQAIAHVQAYIEELTPDQRLALVGKQSDTSHKYLLCVTCNVLRVICDVVCHTPGVVMLRAWL